MFDCESVDGRSNCQSCSVYGVDGLGIHGYQVSSLVDYALLFTNRVDQVHGRILSGLVPSD